MTVEQDKKVIISPIGTNSFTIIIITVVVRVLFNRRRLDTFELERPLYSNNS